MSGVQSHFGFDKKLTYLLRSTDREGEPARSEGLDFIEGTDFGQFLIAGWGELLFVVDFFFRAAVRAEEDPSFVREWQDHGGIGGHGKEIFFQRVMEVSLVWRERLHAIERHHTDAGTEPRLDALIPSKYYSSPSLLDYILDPSRQARVKFTLLGSLTQIIIAHASLASCRTSLEASRSPESAREGADWLAVVAAKILITGRFSPVALLGLGGNIREEFVTVAERVASSYGPELEQQVRSEPSTGLGNRRVVIIDPQLALDLVCLESAFALGRFFDSGDDEERQAFDGWLTELRRMVTGTVGEGASVFQDQTVQVGNWFRPIDKVASPSCIPEAEHIARELLTNMLARRGIRECIELSASPGELLHFQTRREVIIFRIPRETSRSLDGRGAVAVRRAAFSRFPLLTWLLYPASSTDADSAFWTEGLHGAFFRAMVGVSAYLQDRQESIAVRREIERMVGGRSSSSWIHDLLVENLPSDAVKSALDMASNVLGYWLDWGTRPESEPERPHTDAFRSP